MKALQDLEIFVRTAASGSLTAAARGLDLTPAAASAALKRLEAELGAQLFVRSTRSLRLTPDGEAFLAECGPALATLQDAAQRLGSGREVIRGTLKLSAPSDFGRNLLLPWLEEFQALHPGIQLRLQLSDRIANIYSDPVDAAFRYGRPPDSGLIALPVALENRRILCAAPSYLARHGEPAAPQDLAQHACLCFMFGDEIHDQWRFAVPGQAEVEAAVPVRVRATNVSNDGEVVRRWALWGRGIAYKSGFDVMEDLMSGALRPLCTDWLGERTPLYLLLPDRRQSTPALRLLREFVAERVQALAQRYARWQAQGSPVQAPGPGGRPG